MSQIAGSPPLVTLADSTGIPYSAGGSSAYATVACGDDLTYLALT